MTAPSDRAASAKPPAATPEQLLAKYPLISDQVNKDQLVVILRELDRVLTGGNAAGRTGTDGPGGSRRPGTPEGAVVEFGCYIGTTSLFIRRLLDARQSSPAGDHIGRHSAPPDVADNTGCEFHVYDSFAGLPAKTAQDQSRAGDQFRAGELAVSKKQFLQQFQKAGLKPPIIHKGWFSGLTAADVPDCIAFAFLDGDFYESIRDSLKLVLPRLQKGGTIVVDDYAREALPGAAKAVHELLPHAPVRVQHNLGVIRTA